MNEFVRGFVPPQQRIATRENLLNRWIAGAEDVRKLIPATTEAEAKAFIERTVKDVSNDEIYMNDTYQVNVRRSSAITHLSIKRRDKQPIHDWRDLQEIKNRLVGPEFEAIEIYPAESRRVDTANQYHLWVLPAGAAVPFGFQSRCVSDDIGIGEQQRKL